MNNLRKRRQAQSGFTLIELIVVVTIIGILAAIAVANVKWAQRKAQEAALRDNLFEMRKAIDNYYADKQKYPAALDDLKPNYLRSIPVDPITKKDDWETVQDNPTNPDEATDPDPQSQSMQAPGIIDVKSRAPGQTLDGTAYNAL
jgi:general secretion pathway protein G